MSDLPVCKKCGWHMLTMPGSHDRECDPEAGAAADRLAAMLGTIPSTKLGHGHGRLTFNFDDEHSLTLRAHEDGTFAVESVFWLGEFDEAIATQLVRSLNGVAEIIGKRAPCNCESKRESHHGDCASNDPNGI